MFSKIAAYSSFQSRFCKSAKIIEETLQASNECRLNLLSIIAIGLLAIKQLRKGE